MRNIHADSDVKGAKRADSGQKAWCLPSGLLLLLLLLGGWSTTAGQTSVAPARSPSTEGSQQPLDPALSIETVELWPQGAPGARGTSAADIPTLTVFQPRPGLRNGTGVIIAPGGAYLGLAADLEGRDVASWFAAHGITAFVLRYRLGAQYVYPVPLRDAQRAMRLLRFNAQRYGLDPNRLGMMGFSAGGHLAAMVGTLGEPGSPGATDPVDRVSSRPDFLVLAYPWLNAMQPNARGSITYCSVLPKIPPAACKTFETQYTPSNHVNKQTPPTFLYITSDDHVVDVAATLAFESALLANDVPSELHSFAHGAHGSGMGNGDPALDQWPLLLEGWLRGRGLLASSPRPSSP